MAKQIKMTPSAASRIQSSFAKSNAGLVTKTSFPARAQRAAATNVKTAVVKSKS